MRNTCLEENLNPLLNSIEDTEEEPSAEELAELEKQEEEDKKKASTQRFSKRYCTIHENNTYTYSNQVHQFPILTREQEIELAKKIEAGDEKARERMIVCNLRLVISIAYKHNRMDKWDISDLIQDGTLGLMKAVEKYDYRRGFKFSTYATWWIKQSICREAANTCRTIRLPAHCIEDLSKLSTEESTFVYENGREASLEELSAITGINKERIEILKNHSTPISLSSSVSPDDDSTELIDLLPDNSPSVQEQFVSSYLEERLPTAISQILKNERMVYIVSSRFGLGGNPPMTLEEIAKNLGITRERVRQIQSKAFRILRANPNFKRMFKDFVS